MIYFTSYLPNKSSLKIVLALFLFTIFMLLSCESDIYRNSPSMVVIIKADDLGNMTSNWERFIQNVEDNNICASIGIISSQVTDRKSIIDIKEVAEHKQSNGFPIIEFWNHGFDHFGNNSMTEFWGTSKEYQIEHIKKAQEFIFDSLDIQCTTFSSPFNRTSAETYEALNIFPEIKIIMTHRKSEIFEKNSWIEVKRKHGKMNVSKLRLQVQFQSVYDVPFSEIKKNINKIPLDGYLVVQIHPNAWDESDFSTFQEMIDFFKKKQVQFMTPQQYYKYLQKP